MNSVCCSFQAFYGKMFLIKQTVKDEDCQFQRTYNGLQAGLCRSILLHETKPQ